MALVDLGYIRLKELKEQGSMGETCKYHSGARGHLLEDCDEFNKEIQSLIDRGIIRWGKSEEVECCMAFNEQLTLVELNARIENLENQQDRLLYLVHRLVDLRIDTSMSDLTCGVDVMGALASIEHANERSYVEKRSEGSQRQKSHLAPTIRTPQGMSQPRQSQSKQNVVAPVRQMVPARQVQEALEKFPPLPMPISQLYHILLKERLVAPILPRRIIDSPSGEFSLLKTCKDHFGCPGHSLEECKPLWGTIQGLIDNNIIQFENATITDSSPTSCKGQVNVLIKNRG